MTLVLVTGGAGFIGSHLVDALLTRGDRVRVLDNLDPQAHDGGVAPHLNRDAELIVGDLRDRDAVARALDGVELVFHEAGMVGNGQSMYDLHRYIDVNAGGTAVLLEEAIARRDRVRRLVAASSMVVYGEGRYRCADHGELNPGPRADIDLERRRWEPRCPECGAELQPVPTREDTPLRPTSAYAISKRDSEELVLVAGRANGLATVALRYLNVYGPRQALGNPYTGVAAIFATRALSGKPPLLFEDGAQRRDLTHVSDIVEANLLAADAPDVVGRAVNVGTGSSITVAELAATLSRSLGRPDLAPEVTGRYRAGDIRHCWADLTMARLLLGYDPVAPRSAALDSLAEWVAAQTPVDRTDEATRELTARGLIR